MEKIKYIDHADIAKVLLSESEQKCLEAFMREPLSLSESARALGYKLNTMHYRIKRFIDMGLIEQVEDKLLGKRYVTAYGATAKAFIIPFESSSAASLENLLMDIMQMPRDHLFKSIEKTLLDNQDLWEVVVTLVDDELNTYLRPKRAGLQDVLAPSQAATLARPDTPAMVVSGGNYHLAFDKAKAFQRELLELLERYQQQEDDAEQAYYFFLVLTPAHE
ncbi:MAG: helix-turn-helix domain-containing protein [Deinococcales bacterium]